MTATPPPETAHVQPIFPGDGDAEPPEPPLRLAVDIVLDEADWTAFGDAEALIAAAALAVGALSDFNDAAAEAVVALSSDAEVAALNGAYRGKPVPTNVLSFPAAANATPAHAQGVRMLGDIIIARETVLREAAEQGLPPSARLQHLVVHGLLHLLGYDHETQADAEMMEPLEVRLLASLGIADPYAEIELEEAKTNP